MSQKRPKILVAPLDWGLGHATRCIPIIKLLLEKGCEVVLAAGGIQKKLLEVEFPSLRIISIPGYRISYGGNRALTVLKIFYQIPKILIQINRERRWLSRFIDSEGLDGIISDNRYGLYHPRVRSIFVCHQLAIRTPLGRIGERLLMSVHYRKISRFSACWVPDFATGTPLAGELSHPSRLPAIPLRYIGPLTRLERTQGIPDPQSLLVLLSGPEPQRSILEKKLMGQIENFPGKITLVRGLPGEAEIPPPRADIRLVNHLPSGELGRVIVQSGLVIARSGYSTIMDLLSLGKKAVLIPTPGQPEQEYLAGYLFGRRLAYAEDQSSFDLSAYPEKLSRFAFAAPPESDGSLLREAVDDWIAGGF